MNLERRAEQDRIYKAATAQAEHYAKDRVLVVSDASWSHGIVGIVAAKLLEKFHKPTFVLQELEDGTAKGSARSFGDFSAVDGIRATEHLLQKGGGHKLAAGVTLKSDQINDWRRALNDFYMTLKLGDQSRYLLPQSDVICDDFELLDEVMLREVSKLEPYGNGNPVPVFQITPVEIMNRRVMGGDGQHVKYTLIDQRGKTLQTIAFYKADEFVLEVGERASVWLELMVNEWQGRRTVEGRLVRMELAD